MDDFPYHVTMDKHREVVDREYVTGFKHGVFFMLVLIACFVIGSMV